MPKLLRARAPRDDGEARKIRRLAGARHAPADWIERAQIVALSWDGLGVAEVAARAGCYDNTVRRWLHRFNAAGIGGLGNRPGPGRTRRITEARRRDPQAAGNLQRDLVGAGAVGPIAMHQKEPVEHTGELED